MHLSLLFTSLAFCRSCAAADPMTVKNPLLTLTEENADALSHSASMDGYTAVYSPMFQLGSGAGSVSGDAVLKRGHLPVSDAVLKSGHSLDVTYLPRPDAEIETLSEVSQRLRTTANPNGFLTAPLAMGAMLTLPDFTDSKTPAPRRLQSSHHGGDCTTAGERASQALSTLTRHLSLNPSMGLLCLISIVALGALLIHMVPSYSSSGVSYWLSLIHI